MRKITIALIISCIALLEITFAMEQEDLIFETQRQYGNVATLDVYRSGKGFLSNIELIPTGTNPGVFVDDVVAYHDNMGRLLADNNYFCDGYTKKILLVDFDGTLAMNEITGPEESKFFAIGNSDNMILTRPMEQGRNKLEKDGKVESLARKVIPREYKLPKPSEQKEIVWLFVRFFLSQVNKGREMVSDFSLSFVPVSDRIKDLLQEFKTRGYQLYILSGRPITEQKKEHIAKNYASLFGSAQLDRFNKERKMSFSDFDENFGYYYAEKKPIFVRQLVNFGKSGESDSLVVGYLDDHVQMVDFIKNRVSEDIAMDQSNAGRVAAFFWPYPILAKVADEDIVAKEIENLVKLANEQLLRAFSKFLRKKGYLKKLEESRE